LLVAALSLSIICCTRHRPPPPPEPAPPEHTLVSGEQAAQLVGIRDLKISRKGEVSATLVNNAHHPLRDVRLLIRHSWMWKNERKPGDKNPSRAVYQVGRDLIAPGATAKFTYQPAPPLPSRGDGHFVTTTEVIGYSEVGG